MKVEKLLDCIRKKMEHIHIFFFHYKEHSEKILHSEEFP